MESSTAVLNDAPPVAVSGEPGTVRRLVTRRRLVRAAVVVAALALASGLVHLRAWPPFATVMSASMSPSIDTGDVVVMKRLDGLPQVGDVISVTVPQEARTRYGYPPTVIHRVVRIGADGRITTKGDARREADPFTVDGRAVRAKVVTSVPAAGRVMAFLTSPMGILWVAAGLLLFVVLPLVERQREAQRRSQDGIDELRGDVQGLADEVVRLQYEVGARDRAQATLEATLAGLPAVIRTEVTRAIEAATPAPPPDPPAPPAPPPPPQPSEPVHPVPSRPPAEAPAQSGFIARAGRRARALRRRN